MKMKPVFIAFSTQKGGVGKTTFTVLAASYLHYVCGYNVLVVDCDYPQFSINEMRKRDAKGLETNSSLQELAIAQFSRLQKPTYSILCTTSDEAIGVVQDYLEQNESETDFVFFRFAGHHQYEGCHRHACLYGLHLHAYLFRPYFLGKHAEFLRRYQAGGH